MSRLDLDRLVLSASLLAALGCGGDRPILNAARTFAERQIAGDLVPILPMLSAPDQRAANQIGYPRNLPDGMGLSSTGILGGKLDSVVRIGSLGGDSAMVGVYLTVPNYEQAFGSMLLGAMSGAYQRGGEVDTAAVARQMREEVGSLPRVTVVDTLRLVREGRKWRIALGLPQRMELAKAYAPLRDSYLEVPLAERAATAQRFLAVANRYRGYASSVMVAEAQKLVRHGRLASALRITVRAESGYLGGSVRGTVVNPNRTRLQDVWIEVSDGNSRRSLRIHSIPARGTEDVYEPFATLRPGRLSAHVLALKLPGEDD